MKDIEALLDEKEIAKILGVSTACLRRWRLENRGPRFLRIGSRVRYPPSDLRAYLESVPGGGDTPATLIATPPNPRNRGSSS